jgi:hypothetical protein
MLALRQFFIENVKAEIPTVRVGWKAVPAVKHPLILSFRALTLYTNSTKS